MTVNYNTSVVSNGLIMVLDAQNPKSYQYGENLMTYSQGITSANGWGFGSNTTFISSSNTAPDGTYTATSVYGNGSGANEYIVKQPLYLANTWYTASCWARLANGTTPTQGAIISVSYPTTPDGANNQTRSVVTYNNNLTSTWKRFSTSYYVAASGLYSAFFLADQTNTATVEIWGIQVEKSSVVGKYTPTTSSTIISSPYWVNAAGNTSINMIKANLVNTIYTSGSNVANTVIYNTNSANTLAFWDFSSLLNMASGVEGQQNSNTIGFLCNSCPIPTTGSFTLTTFIKRSPANLFGRENVFGNAAGADGFRFGIQSYNGVASVPYYLIGGLGGSGYQEGSFGTPATVNFADGNWHLLTIVYDRSAQLGSYAIYTYFDTTLIGSATITAGAYGNVAFTPNAPGIGIYGCCYPFMGAMSYLAAYNRALTQDEIRQNFNALRGRFGI
jgi:hypothetical protein